MTTLLVNKPFRMLSQFTTNGAKATLAAIVRQPGIYAAGRLDYDSEGLLLLTDDGPLAQRIAHPRAKLSKVYLAQVEGGIDAAALAFLRRGVELKDGLSAPAQAEQSAEPDWLWPRDPPVRWRAQIPTSWLRLTIQEGRNRQVRRMTAAVGYPTLRLIREQIGPWKLDGLRPGESRPIPDPWRDLERAEPPFYSTGS